MKSEHMLGMRVELLLGVRREDHRAGAIVKGGRVRCDGCAAEEAKAQAEGRAFVGSVVMKRSDFEEHT